MKKTNNKVRFYDDVISRLDSLKKSLDNFSIYKLGKLDNSAENYDIFYVRSNLPNTQPNKRICLSAGIHGDEPAGVQAILAFLENFPKYSELLDGTELTILPCDNPFGYERNIRNNADGLDLNQQFHNSKHIQEIRFVKKAIGQTKFDITLDFHEDVESKGFYLWERKHPAVRSVGKAIIEEIAKKYPIEPESKIEGFPNIEGIVSLSPKSLEKGYTREYYLFSKGAKCCLTLETPVNMCLQKRVDMHLLALKKAVEYCIAK